MTELLHLYGQLDFRVRPLVFAVRYWAKETELTAQSGGPYLSNFMLTLMAIYYLQQGDCPLLPSVDQLRQYAGTVYIGFGTIVLGTYSLSDYEMRQKMPARADST